jgi:hypothetical protein
LPEFSGLTFSGTRWPGFSGRICCFWPEFSSRSFSGMGNLKKLYGQQANFSGIYSGIFCPKYGNFLTGIFWREAKTKRLFHSVAVSTLMYELTGWLIASNCQCKRCNSSEFNPSILRHNGI